MNTQDSSHSASSPPLPSHTRKSSRQTKPPAWLQDYLCSVVPSKVQYPILVPEDMSHLSDAYKTSLCNALAIHEPSYYEQARGETRWEDAMKKELAASEADHTLGHC